MKKQATFLLCAILLLLINGIKAQTDNGSSVKPYFKSGNSVLFGKDIIINNNVNQNQRNVVICSAFNGWLYAAYSYINMSLGFPSLTILKSEDNGISWSILRDGLDPVINGEFNSLDIIATGDSISNITVYLASLVSNFSLGIGQTYVTGFNGETGDPEYQLVNEYGGYDVAISSDFMYPSTNSNPFSIGVLYSKNSNQKDSIIFRSSSNGGISLDNKKIVAVSSQRFHKVSLSYGRSVSQNSGRYFAVWEEKNDYNSSVGHIFTAHSEPDFNSSFTAPVKLDSLDATAIGNSRNPVISCQNNNLDNDSLNLTEVVLFDKYLPADNKYDIEGFYNMTSASTNNFKQFTLSSSADNKQQPDMNFNPFDSTFMVTYYDSTTQKLPFLSKTLNMTNPNVWQVVSSGYNDDTNLAAPYPKVALDIGQQQGVDVWANGVIGSNGIALFDAPYSTWTGISGGGQKEAKENFWIYPNPCTTIIKIGFELKTEEQVNITLFNLISKPMGIITDRLYTYGIHLLIQDVSFLTPGCYLLTYKHSNTIETRELFIIR